MLTMMLFFLTKILFLLGCVYAVRRRWFSRLTPIGIPLPGGELDSFVAWRRAELTSIDISLFAAWGGIVALFFLPGYLNSLRLTADQLFFAASISGAPILVCLAVAVIYGSRAIRRAPRDAITTLCLPPRAVPVILILSGFLWTFVLLFMALFT